MVAGSERWACRRSSHTAASSNELLGSLVVTHPFHPLVGQRLEVLYVRREAAGRMYVCDAGNGRNVKLDEAGTDRGAVPVERPLTLEVRVGVGPVGGELGGGRWMYRCQACCPRRSRRSRTWSSARWWRVPSVVSAVEKIAASHLQRVAIVYLRQSSPRQVRENFRSTERQYALAEEAARLGWEAERIAVVDGDLGISGRFSDTQARKGYAQLVSRVCLGEVGAIFGLEVSRLARSNAETQRLLEFCALTDTLVVDTDGVYDLQNFNDRLLLGLKSQMSEAELHMITSRLQGAKRAAAERGELRFPLPVGYLHDEDGQTIIDPDQEVQAAIRDLFCAFEQTGSAYGVV